MNTAKTVGAKHFVGKCFAPADFATALDLLKETLDNPHTFRLYYMQLQNAFLS